MTTKIEHWRSEAGQTMAEYGVVLSVLIIGVIAAIGFFATAVAGKIDDVVSIIGSAVA